MVFKIKVTLSGIKGFYRIYLVNGATTLYTLHKQLRADMEFPQDQLIMFKALTSDGSVTGRYGLFDLGSGTVDAVSLEKAVKAGAASFVYFYDVTNRKSVNISVEEDASAAKVNPDFPVPSNSRTVTWLLKTCRRSSASCPGKSRKIWTMKASTKKMPRTRRKTRKKTKTERKSLTRTNRGWGKRWRLYSAPPV